MSTPLAGAGALVRLILRRDRWILLPGLLLLAAYPIIEVANASAGYVELARNPGFRMLYGPLYGSSIGATATWSSGDFLWMYGLVSMLVVIRHTRAEEEAGRRELLGASEVGRHAGLAAALVVVLAANMALALVITLGAITQGLPVAGSIALGLRCAAVGCVFAAVAAVVAQLTETASAARGMGATILGGFLLVRAAGDSGDSTSGLSWLSWLSPLGWSHRIRPFAGERWWILGLFAAATGTLVVLSVALSAHRDIGAGAVAPRLGPDRAASALRSPLGLAWRLQWRPMLGWAAGFAVIGGVFAGAANSAADVFAESDQLRDLFERLGGEAGASDTFLAGIMSILGLVAGAYAVQAALRLRTEEQNHRAEPMLAAPVTRLRWATSHLVFALVGPLVALTVAGLVAGIVYGLGTGSVGRELPRVLAAAIVQVSAAWLLAAITLALFGLVPRLAPGGWAAWATFLSIWALGAFGQLNPLLLDLSPFTHVPKLPGAPLTATPIVWLGALTVALAITGLVGFRHRDVGPV